MRQWSTLRMDWKASACDKLLLVREVGINVLKIFQHESIFSRTKVQMHVSLIITKFVPVECS